MEEVNNNKKSQKKLSKFLSLILRHRPHIIGISLTEKGWTDTQTLIERMNANGRTIDMETLCTIVETNDKKRYAFNEDKSLIRANQGHSVKVNLGYQEKTPPTTLYHGTAKKNLDSIFKTGIVKRNRHQVHLSSTKETAIKVGQRHGKPVVLIVLSEEMHKEGFTFYESDNGVWLTDHVPVKFLATFT